jgi:hypothetical protein
MMQRYISGLPPLAGGPRGVRVHYTKNYMRYLNFFILFLPLLVFAAPTEPASVATDFEWELTVPDRVLYRDRVTVGQVALTTVPSGKKAAKTTGETLALIGEIAFVPGDSLARYFGASLELTGGAAVILDAGELPALDRMLDYTLNTARDIAATDRSDTRFQFRSKAGLLLGFAQHGKAQQFEIRFPAHDPKPETVRFLNRDQLSTLKDLLDLALFELKRQGAVITMPRK